MDLVINHTSDQHPWFKKSIRKIKPYTDYYVWVDPKGFNEDDGSPIPPNNWLSVFEGSAWKWNHLRKQFYYHKFEYQQPDLNLRNRALKSELKKILQFWYNKGISGFRLDAARNYMEDTLLRDEPLRDPKNKKAVLLHCDLNHIYTGDQPEGYEFIHELRGMSDACYSTKNDDKILVPESWGNLTTMTIYYGNETYKMTHFPFNFGFVVNTYRVFPNPVMIDSVITNWLKAMPPNAVANWLVENHDISRLGNRCTAEFMDIFLIIIMTLPGVAFIYYGQEIGLIDAKLKPDSDFPNDVFDLREKQLRARHPMQWNDSPNAGFTRSKRPWLSVNPDYWHVNVETQKMDRNSRYNLFKILSKLRRKKTLKYGKLKSYLLSSRSYAFTRSTDIKREKQILVVVNLSLDRDVVNLSNHIPNLPSFGKILTTSLNIRKEAPIASYQPLKFSLKPLSAIVFEFKES